MPLPKHEMDVVIAYTHEVLEGAKRKRLSTKSTYACLRALTMCIEENLSTLKELPSDKAIDMLHSMVDG